MRGAPRDLLQQTHQNPKTGAQGKPGLPIRDGQMRRAKGLPLVNPSQNFSQSVLR